MTRAKLNMLTAKLTAMEDITRCWRCGTGVWGDGTGEDGLVFQCDDGSLAQVVKKPGYAYEYVICYPNTRIKHPISDEDMIEILTEGVQKAKRTKKKAK